MTKKYIIEHRSAKTGSYTQRIGNAIVSFCNGVAETDSDDTARIVKNEMSRVLKLFVSIQADPEPAREENTQKPVTAEASANSPAKTKDKPRLTLPKARRRKKK